MVEMETILYMGTSIAVIVLVLSNASNYGILSPIVFVIGIIVLFFVMAMNFADFLVFPFITKRMNVQIQLSKDHMVPETQNCVIKNANGLYYATGYLTGNIYKYVFSAENITPGEEENLSSGPEKWERILMNTNFTFKFNLVSVPEDVQKYREALEGKRGYLEFQLSREEQNTTPNALTIKEIERQINIIQTRIDRISDGELPTYSIMYIESTAVGVSQKEAMDVLNNQLAHLQTVFNSFDLSIIRVVGREVHHLYGMNYRITNLEEMTKLFQVQN
jgi:hypothetical protein